MSSDFAPATACADARRARLRRRPQVLVLVGQRFACDRSRRLVVVLELELQLRDERLALVYDDADGGARLGPVLLAHDER